MMHVPADALGKGHVFSRAGGSRIFTLDLMLEMSPASMVDLYSDSGNLFAVGDLADAPPQAASFGRRGISELETVGDVTSISDITI